MVCLLSLLVLSFSLLIPRSAGAALSSSPLADENLLGEIINALGFGLVTQINATITLQSLENNIISWLNRNTPSLRINFIVLTVQNPLPFELTLKSVISTAGIDDTVYAKFGGTFTSPIVVPALSREGIVPNVLLTQGATASLEIIPPGFLDLSNVDVHLGRSLLSSYNDLTRAGELVNSEAAMFEGLVHLVQS